MLARRGSPSPIFKISTPARRRKWERRFGVLGKFGFRRAFSAPYRCAKNTLGGLSGFSFPLGYMGKTLIQGVSPPRWYGALHCIPFVGVSCFPPWNDGVESRHFVRPPHGMVAVDCFRFFGSPPELAHKKSVHLVPDVFRRAPC